MEIVLLVARALFVAVFVSSAFGHLTKTEAMAGYTRSKGIPFARPMVLLTGLMLVAGALSVLLGIWADLGALLLVAFLLPTAVLMHGYWNETDPMGRQMEKTQFLKDVSLAGGALALFALFASAGDEVGLTVTGPLFDLN